MKKTIITLALFSVAIFAQAGNSPVNSATHSALNTTFYAAVNPVSNASLNSGHPLKAGPINTRQSIQPVASKEVPQSVVTAFTSRFPNARLKNWQIQKGVFIANFRLDSKKIFAYFNPDGSWRGTESPIKWTKNLPTAVHSGWLKSDYAGWYVQDIKKIETPEGPLYTLHVDNGPTLDSDHHDVDFEECVIFFNESGSLVRKDRMP